MGRLGRHQNPARVAFAALAALALFARILVPAGYMPGTSVHGLMVELCSGVAGQKIYVDLGKNNPGDTSQKMAGECTFASGAVAGALPIWDAFVALPLLISNAAPLGAAIADLTLHRLAAPPPPSHGPPASR